MTDTSTHAAPAAGQFRQHMTGFGVATVAAVFMAVTGALGTGAAGFGTRLGFWLVCMLAGGMIGSGVSFTVKVWGGLARRRWAEAALISVLMAAPQTLIVVAARSLFFDLRIPANAGIGWLFGFVLFICAIMVGLDYLVNKDQPIGAPMVRAETAASTPAIASPEARFRERLPHGLRAAQLFALEAEDHYLRVHTDSGSALILLRLADAVTELAGVEGAQTHRSWWAARAAVVSSQRGEGRATLTLMEGLQVPVSRSYYKAINEAGWLS